MTLTIIRPGLLTSIQDLGRYGFQKYGVTAGGVMDPFAHRMANILVGNPEEEATMEITMLGPVLRFEEDALFSICGGNLSPCLEKIPVPLWQPVLARKGSVLRFEECVKGCRIYLAVAGGFNLPLVLGSKSTYLRAGIGGNQGRALQEGDTLAFGKGRETVIRLAERLAAASTEGPFVKGGWTIKPDFLPAYGANPTLRILRGKEFDMFTQESQSSFLEKPFSVTPQSDRMAYRLAGPGLFLNNPLEMISEPVAFGTIQVIPDGNPLILMADRQTIGGYPVIAQIVSVDLPLVAQLKPGDSLRFQVISLYEAQGLYIQRERLLDRIKQGVSLKFS